MLGIAFYHRKIEKAHTHKTRSILDEKVFLEIEKLVHYILRAKPWQKLGTEM